MLKKASEGCHASARADEQPGGAQVGRRLEAASAAQEQGRPGDAVVRAVAAAVGGAVAQHSVSGVLSLTRCTDALASSWSHLCCKQGALAQES